jgi:uncharacterized protein YcfL
MKKTFAVIFFGLLVVGCASTPKPQLLTPVQVASIRVDCQSKTYIINLLESQVKLADEHNIKENLGAIKYKLWEVRTVCGS